MPRFNKYTKGRTEDLYESNDIAYLFKTDRSITIIDDFIHCGSELYSPKTGRSIPNTYPKMPVMKPGNWGRPPNVSHHAYFIYEDKDDPSDDDVFIHGQLFALRLSAKNEATPEEKRGNKAKQFFDIVLVTAGTALVALGLYLSIQGYGIGKGEVEENSPPAAPTQTVESQDVTP